jgi:hypothetical protein
MKKIHSVAPIILLKYLFYHQLTYESIMNLIVFSSNGCVRFPSQISLIGILFRTIIANHSLENIYVEKSYLY